MPRLADKPFDPREISASLGRTSPSDAGDEREYAVANAPVTLKMPKLTPRTIAIAVMGAAALYMLAGMAPTGVFDSPAFPPSGDFRIREDLADAPTGRLKIAADDGNMVLQLHARDGEPVYVGFVRAGEGATLEVPVGTWRSLLVPGEVWEGTARLVTPKQFSSMSRVTVRKNYVIDLSAAELGQDQEQQAQRAQHGD